MKNLDGNLLAKTISRAGMILIESGAETYRVEDTMRRIAIAYGIDDDKVDAYATPTLLMISVWYEGVLYNNIKRIRLRDNNLGKIDEINNLSRQLSLQCLDLQSFNNALDIIDHNSGYSNTVLIIGATICTFGFALFYQGSIYDALASGIIGTLIAIINLRFVNFIPSAFLKNVVLGALLTVIAVVMTSVSSLLDLDTIIISSIMLLVPGIMITNAIRDSVSGDLVSGLSRATQAIFVAIAIALGSGLVFFVLRGIV